MSTFGKPFSFSGGAAGSGGSTGAAGSGGSTGAAGGLFGSSSQQAAPSSSSLFGASTEKRQRAGTVTEMPASLQGGTGSIFGQPATAASGSSVFGQPAAATSGGGLFGNTPAATTAPSGGLFGSMPSVAGSAAPGLSGFSGTGAFGNMSTSQPAPTSSLFGGSSVGTASGGLFGSQQQQQQALPQTQPSQPLVQSSGEAEELSKQLLLIKECWDPASPSYQFRHYFYNVAAPGQAHLYQCPAGQDPLLWQQALGDNPDPATLVPVLANGFDDLRRRVDSQSLQMQSYQERTSEISDKLCEVLQKHHSHTTVRLAECRRRQAELSQRLLEFMKLLQLLRLRGQLLHPEEELFRVRIEHLEREMTRSGSLKQRLAELQDHTYRLQASARRRRELLGHAGSGHAGDGYEVADESQLESVMEVLGDKQKGLARMTQVVAQDAEAIEAVEGAIEDRFAEVQKQKEARERVQVARSLVQPW